MARHAQWMPVLPALVGVAVNSTWHLSIGRLLWHADCLAMSTLTSCSYTRRRNLPMQVHRWGPSGCMMLLWRMCLAPMPLEILQIPAAAQQRVTATRLTRARAG